MSQKIIQNVIFGLPPKHRALIYILTSVFLSQLCDVSNNSESYFAQQGNVLNIYLVKFSWGWTLFMLGSHLFANVMKMNETNNDPFANLKGFVKISARLLIATMVWYYGTGLFLVVEESTGTCGIPKYVDKKSCKDKGFLWKGFDISGHCFLLVWCNLVIIEESRNFIERKNTTTIDLQSGTGDAQPITCNNSSYGRLPFYCLTFITLIWDLMIICTNMFFHTTLEKIIGTTIAVTSWLVLYQIIYKKFLHILDIKY